MNQLATTSRYRLFAVIEDSLHACAATGADACRPHYAQLARDARVGGTQNRTLDTLPHTNVMHSVIILGSGPAGCTAAIYAARAGLNPLLIAGTEPGGQLTTTTEVDNWPGDPRDLTGPALMDRMHDHAKACGANWMDGTASSVTLSHDPKGVHQVTVDGEVLETRTLVIATGAKARRLGLPSESKYWGRGVSSCATCDGFFFRNLDVLVIGGGNTAVEEALYLSNLCRHVTLVHRRDALRAEHALRERINRTASGGNITFHWNASLDEVLGDDKVVTGARLRSTADNTTSDVSCDGIFVAIGHDPQTALFLDSVTHDDHNYLLIGQHDGFATSTSVPGVFACGDVSDSVYRQAITSAGSGCMAALDAHRWITES